MSKLDLPCHNCICLPMCKHKEPHTILQDCKLFASHWGQFITSKEVHRKLSMKRGYRFTTEMNKLMNRFFMPIIYTYRPPNIYVEKKNKIKKYVVFIDLLDVRSLSGSNPHIIDTLSDYERIDLPLIRDGVIGSLLMDFVAELERMSK